MVIQDMSYLSAYQVNLSFIRQFGKSQLYLPIRKILALSVNSENLSFIRHFDLPFPFILSNNACYTHKVPFIY